MSQRLTFKTLKDSRAPTLAGVCATDARFAQWANSFQERALNLGRWWGTTQLAQFCIRNGCLTLPREVAVVEQVNLNGSPVRMANEWYQFVRPHQAYNGSWDAGCCNPNTGCQSPCDCCGCGPTTMEDKLTSVSFATTTGVNKKIRVYPGNAADAGKKIIFQGYDANGIWVRTTIDGVRSNGEQVTLALPFVDTATIWGAGAPTGVIKDETAYRVLVYSINQDDSTEVALADYQPGETLPMYRTVHLSPYRVPSATTGCCSTSTLLAIVSLQHIPVKYDNDWLLFQNLTAYQDGILAEKYREEGNFGLADAYFYGSPGPTRSNRGAQRTVSRGGAIPNLEAELRKMTGDRTTINMQYAGVNLGGFL